MKRELHLSCSEVFGVTHKLNKFRPRLSGRSLNLFLEFVALSNRQIFGASRINSKRLVYNMLVVFRFYLPFISFLWFIHAKIRIILYRNELLNRKIGILDFIQQFFP